MGVLLKWQPTLLTGVPCVGSAEFGGSYARIDVGGVSSLPIFFELQVEIFCLPELLVKLI